MLNGDIVGPLVGTEQNGYIFCAGYGEMTLRWLENGRWPRLAAAKPHPWDLVEEVPSREDLEANLRDTERFWESANTALMQTAAKYRDERDVAIVERNHAIDGYSKAVMQRDHIGIDLASASQERNSMLAGRDAALKEFSETIYERDFARTQRDRAVVEREAWKEVARSSGVCMTCALGAPEPYGCSDCLNTGWNGGAPVGFISEADAAAKVDEASDLAFQQGIWAEHARHYD